MTTAASSEGTSTNWNSLETLIRQNKNIISADDSTVIELVMLAITEKKTATFYLKPLLMTEIRKRYQQLESTPVVDLQPISREEATRIKSDFDIAVDGWASVETCPRCESVYGTYEFIQQGIKEHGEAIVRAVFSLEGVAVLQVHPRQNTCCQSCGLNLTLMVLPVMRDGHDYWYDNLKGGRYACCL